MFQHRELAAKMNEPLECELSPEVVSVITKPLEIDVPAQGNLLRSHSERFENLPEDIKEIQAGETGVRHIFLDVS